MFRVNQSLTLTEKLAEKITGRFAAPQPITVEIESSPALTDGPSPVRTPRLRRRRRLSRRQLETTTIKSGWA